MNWVLDASAVLCWLADEPGAERMEQVLAGDETRVIHAVNLLEIEYYLLRRGEQALQTGLQRLDAVGVEVARDLDDALLLAAARLKAQNAPIALGDTFAVALAAQRGATLLTTDREELGRLDGLGICSFEFLR
jgi:PIN domain nuclease of toxin-antitoxin system